MKRTPWKRDPEKYKGLKRTPMKRSTKPMKKIGARGKINAKDDRATKKEFERKGLDCCQLCGRTGALSRSHSLNKRFGPSRVALLCIFICHKFIELELDHDTRERVNEFIIDTTLEGEDKFIEACKLMPEDKAIKLRKLIFQI